MQKFAFATLLIALASTNAYAMTAAERAQMNREITEQNRIKAERARNGSGTVNQKCTTTNGGLNCSGPTYVAPRAGGQGCGPGFAWHQGKCRPF